MNTHKQTLIARAMMNTKTAQHPTAAKRLGDRARETLMMRAARQGRGAQARVAVEMLPQDLGGAFHRDQRPSFDVPYDANEDAQIPPSLAELV